MTYNDWKKRYNNYKFRTSKEDWKIVEETKGKCRIECNIDDFDKEIYFDVITCNI